MSPTFNFTQSRHQWGFLDDTNSDFKTLRAGPAERIMLYLLGSFFPTQFHASRAEILYRAPLEYSRTIQRGSSFFFFLWKEYMVVSRNIRITFSPKSEGENKKPTLTSFKAVDESDTDHVLRPTINIMETV